MLMIDVDLSFLPAPSSLMSMDFAPASRLFSISSLTTERRLTMTCALQRKGDSNYHIARRISIIMIHQNNTNV